MGNRLRPTFLRLGNTAQKKKKKRPEFPISNHSHSEELPTDSPGNRHWRSFTLSRTWPSPFCGPNTRSGPDHQPSSALLIRRTAPGSPSRSDPVLRQSDYGRSPSSELRFERAPKASPASHRRVFCSASNSAVYRCVRLSVCLCCMGKAGGGGAM